MTSNTTVAFLKKCIIDFDIKIQKCNTLSLFGKRKEEKRNRKRRERKVEI
jgi:hypothetical protein